jgi:hypothetical protein
MECVRLKAALKIQIGVELPVSVLLVTNRLPKDVHLSAVLISFGMALRVSVFRIITFRIISVCNAQ